MTDLNNLIVQRDGFKKLENSIVTLLVGERKIRYTIHGKNLVVRSKGQFDESVLAVSSDDRSIALPNITKSVCELYLHFLQVGNFPLQEDKTFSGERCQHMQGMCATLVELCSMSEILSDKQSMDATISGIVEIFRHQDRELPRVVPGLSNIKKVYTATKPTSKLRPLMVDLYLSKAGSSEIDGHLPHAFLVDLAKAAVAIGLRSEPDLSPCLYHEHAAMDPCPPRSIMKKRTHAEMLQST